MHYNVVDMPVTMIMRPVHLVCMSMMLVAMAFVVVLYISMTLSLILI